MAKKQAPPATRAANRSVDLLVVGSGTGMAAALAAHELGLSTLIVEKTEYVGGSTARSGGAFWIPGSSVLTEYGKSRDPLPAAREYIRSVVGETAPVDRGLSFLDNGAATVEMLGRTTPLKFFWAKGYSDYHPEQPGGRADGRTCESRPFDMRVLGRERRRLRPGVMEAPVPMPVTGADYKWFNLMVRKPLRAVPKIVRRAALGIGGMALGREYAAGGQALAAGMYAGVLNAGIPVWTETSLVGLLQDSEGRVTGAVVRQDGQDSTIDVRCGVVLAAGGFDHNVEWRRKYQSDALPDNASLGAEGNTGDAIALSQNLGAGLALMDQAWWFPAFAPLPGESPMVMLAERSLPGSFVVDQSGRRFINESVDYMSFGQEVLRRERAGSPVSAMWMIFDQKYRNSYIMAGGLFPGQPLPQEWYDAGIACRAESPGELASLIDVPAEALEATFRSFGEAARSGTDAQFSRGDSAYDRYYGDPTIRPNPNLRALEGTLFAVKMVLSDLGTCGGVTADASGRVLGEDGAVIDGLYAIGNTAANAFGATYPGAGATIGQGLVYGYVAARHAASTLTRTAVEEDNAAVPR
ncbi:3-ketosteroid-delta-1-dehydrogenase [Gordonia terrae]|uniref:3-ketosteroid-delta-1-dehydrogenase n=2 Tax=Gordonia terrae TaxID=2055 RepID=A0AAD0NW87_9ACTN|nr:3-ketosteroid-delta-1-dehydrogenase [Gordonia terrae]VTR09605.1 flavocytochrome c [Clostridioides difficile]ANY22216.1 3-ketosteroid-delta-1-dehydrogenase [Gordonia terrae]AWO82957.1 3-ketosteroid-delta-1-dehydrogenase [Gordonia terrae]VTS29869.1 3-oxosteroid 1-dehydrogenase [Gordonia terrae]GAB46316.1 3-ketosteroid delta(1)-dehydrogenase [Gordonia terrae NBRC 100016]